MQRNKVFPSGSVVEHHFYTRFTQPGTPTISNKNKTGPDGRSFIWCFCFCCCSPRAYNNKHDRHRSTITSIPQSSTSRQAEFIKLKILTALSAWQSISRVHGRRCAPALLLAHLCVDAGHTQRHPPLLHTHTPMVSEYRGQQCNFGSTSCRAAPPVEFKYPCVLRASPLNLLRNSSRAKTKKRKTICANHQQQEGLFKIIIPR